MIRDFGRAHDFQLALNYHTFGNLFIYPWAYSDTVADTGFVVLAPWMTRDNQYHYGTSSQTVGYAVNGSSDDWLFGETGAYSFTPEVSQSGFWPSSDEIDGLNKDNVWANLALALAGLNYGEARDRSPNFITQAGAEISFELTRYGAQDGPLTVSLVPLTGNVLSVSPVQTLEIDRFETTEGVFPLQLAPTVAPGEPVDFLLRTDNGFFVRTDTLHKTFAGSIQALFSENGTNLAPFSGPWGVTQATFVSPPSSITDSPAGNYAASAVSVLELSTPVFIPADAIRPHLRFYARWELEEDYDYVMVTASNNTQYVELCGIYTEPGSGNQPFESPVFDGAQTDWVEESMDLSDFAGKQVTITFILGADGAVSLDGFYFDDLQIAYLDSAVSGITTVPLEAFRLLPPQPNPASTSTVLRWETPAPEGEAELLVFNALGQPVYRQDVNFKNGNNQVSLDTRTWAAGVYTYYFRLEDKKTGPMKLTVIR